jgi:hypothetical protein
MEFDLKIFGGQIIDGSGASRYVGDIGVACGQRLYVGGIQCSIW